jgi:FkbM family methyltransferase
MLDVSGTLAGTIAVVFVRREYGEMKEFRTIVDIGANMGTFALYAAQNCPGARIYCYEPERRNFECLSQNIRNNKLEGRVAATQCAVASTSARREMAVGLSPLHSLVDSASIGERQVVDCMTLADILRERSLESVDLLKVNCEGAEYEIFGNCAQEHLNRIRNIRLEYHVLDAVKKNGDSLCRLLKDLGFTIERFTRYKGESGFIWAGRS